MAVKQIKLGAKSWDEACKSTELAALRQMLALKFSWIHVQSLRRWSDMPCLFVCAPVVEIFSRFGRLLSRCMGSMVCDDAVTYHFQSSAETIILEICE